MMSFREDACPGQGCISTTGKKVDKNPDQPTLVTKDMLPLKLNCVYSIYTICMGIKHPAGYKLHEGTDFCFVH